MRRREFLCALGSVATWPIVARAKQAGRTYRVALLAPAQVGAVDERRKSIIDGLAARGFVGMRRVAMLWNAADLGMTMRYKSAETAAKVLDVSVQALGVREPNDFDDAFAAMTQSLPDAILMVSDALTNLNRRRVIDFANANKLPAIYELSTLVRDGGLMSYGPSQTAIGERIRFRRSHSPGRKTSGPASGAADQIRDADQSQDRQVARPQPSCATRGPRRRGDRINRN